MVLIHVKKGDDSQFLFEANSEETVETVLNKITNLYNGRLKIERICSEMEQLAEHGTQFPPEIIGLTDEQVSELKLVDHWGDKCIPSGGYEMNKDPFGRRNGKRPLVAMQNLIKNTIAEAKEMITKKLVLQDKIVTMKIIHEALNILKGACTIIYPMKLPPHDPIRMEFENIEDLAGTQASLDVIDPMQAQLWFCGRELYKEKYLKDYTGQNEKCKVIMKLSKKGAGAPAREPIMSEEDRKKLMMHAYRKQEEMKKLQEDDDDHYLDSEWADSGHLKRSCQGIKNISWGPRK